MNKHRLLFLLVLATALPLHAEEMVQPRSTECPALQAGTDLTLADAVQQAFCRNPQTRQWWATVGSQEAQVQQARAAYWPQLSAQYQAAKNWNQASETSSVNTPSSLGLSASYILYDFGGRDAGARLAEAQLKAAIATRDDNLNSLAYQVSQAYLDTLLAEASLKSARISEQSALEALKAAEARLSVGSTIPATVLQAQTAYAQAQLTRIKAEGTLSTSHAKLAMLMGFEPQTAFNLAVWHVEQGISERVRVDDLIERALANRRDLASARQQVKAAEATVDSARAQGMPSISLGASAGRQIGSTIGNYNTQSLGVTVSMPIFTGYKDTYRIKAAQADLENKRAGEAALADQVRLDVWNAYQTLQTNINALQSAHDAVKSGNANEQLQLGRFKAGVGTMLDVLSAQASASSARQQMASAEHDYLLSKFALAQALGRLNNEALPSTGE